MYLQCRANNCHNPHAWHANVFTAGARAEAEALGTQAAVLAAAPAAAEPAAALAAAELARALAHPPPAAAAARHSTPELSNKRMRSQWQWWRA